MSDGEREDGSGREGDLEKELRALGRGMRVPDVDGETMAERVLAQLLADATPAPIPPSISTSTSTTRPESVGDPVGDPAPVRGWAARVVRLRRLVRRRWRALLAGLSGLLVVLVLTPPVRAAVADWFDFGGVQVRYDPKASPGPGGPVPGCADPLPLDEAARKAGFMPRIPAELGAPDQVSLEWVSADRPVMSLCWTDPAGGTIRLDEFRAGLDLMFAKQVRHMPEWVSLNAGEGNETTALWFADPHLLRFRMFDEEGAPWSHSARMTGPTLLWEATGAGASTDERLTLRLEGVDSRARATAIAESMPS
ncbi:hypothetical protein [Streptomyces sp. NPDC058653]|uniref:hypothetical protein n=1 Tax=Streptomyces sp. NPDC058653 TaxID=3346576 RepID=UPI0036566626